MTNSKFRTAIIDFVNKHIPDRETLYSVTIEARAGHEFNTVNLDSKSHGVETHLLDPRQSDLDILELIQIAGYSIDYVRYTFIIVKQTDRPIITLQYTLME